MGAIATNGHGANGHAANGHAPAGVNGVNRLAGVALPQPPAAPAAAGPPSDGGGNGGAAAPSSGREAAGRFVKGNRLGRRFARGNKAACGNPFTRRLGEMRAAFLDAVRPDDVQDLAHALLAKALAGDLAAAAIFLQYAVGKPTEAVDPDSADHDEFLRAVRRLPRGEPMAEGIMVRCNNEFETEVVQKLFAAVRRLMDSGG